MKMDRKLPLLIGIILIGFLSVKADELESELPKAEDDVGKHKEGSRTDDDVIKREEEEIKLDGLSVAQMKELRKKAEKHAFQAEVNRMMKLIINSLYRNKEIFLRELISNGSDALDKIRLLSLTDKEALGATEEMSIKIKADKENHVLHVIDTGIGMTKSDLVNNLGTIARSGTSEFLDKLSSASHTEQQDLIGQFGVGFYSAFLVADKIVVTSKSNEDEQYIWESDAGQFTVVKDPRGTTLERGTQVSLHLKEEAHDFLEPDTLKELVKKYSQFINFNIYLWSSKTETVEEPIEDEEEAEKEEKKDETEDDEGKVEEEKEDKPKTKKVEKTTWDWELVNDVRPVWLRKPGEVDDKDYKEFYKAVSKDYDEPLTWTHFTAEGEVTFKSILYVPKRSPHDMFQDYGKRRDHIKLFVRRVFITDDFTDMMPKYLSFVSGIVDSDDLPLNVGRETLQQHKLLNVIKKKLVRKVLDMFKKMDDETFDTFFKEFSTNLKLGVMEDQSNRNRISKLLRFPSSNDPEKVTSLTDYVSRMKDKQTAIYYVAAQSRDEAEKSPFVERLLKKGFEVLFMVEPVDEYCIQSLPEFDGKKFQNVAKEGLDLDGDSEKAKERQKELEDEFKPLTTWLQENALKDKVEKAVVSQRLTQSPCALVASSYGWTGNMERIMRSQAYAKAKDPTQDFYAKQKKTLEVNPRHPVIKELLKRVEADKEDKIALNTASLMFDTATLRSGFMLRDTVQFADQIDVMLKSSLSISPDEAAEEEEEPVDEEEGEKAAEEVEAEDEEEKEGRDEL